MAFPTSSKGGSRSRREAQRRQNAVEQQQQQQQQSRTSGQQQQQQQQQRQQDKESEVKAWNKDLEAAMDISGCVDVVLDAQVSMYAFCLVGGCVVGHALVAVMLNT